MLKKTWDNASLRTKTLREIKDANAVFRFCTGTQKEVKE
jgi:hypothetical protein